MPTTADVVTLGFADSGAVPNVAQNIVVDENAFVNRLLIHAVDNRSVTLTAANSSILNISFVG